MKRFQPLRAGAKKGLGVRSKGSKASSVVSKFLSGMGVKKNAVRKPTARADELPAAAAAAPSRRLSGALEAAAKGECARAPLSPLAGNGAAAPAAPAEEPEPEPEPHPPVLVLHNPVVETHLVHAEHQERPARTVAARRVGAAFAASRGGVAVDWAAGDGVTADDVTAAILRAHSERYYGSLLRATRQAPLDASVVDLTPGGDTVGCRHSLDAARAAAAVGLAAVRAVCGRHGPRTAVCLVRPPGHHAARDGKTKIAPSQGFCLLNTAAIAALEAASALGKERVAVIDFDIHHGNGTQDILAGDSRCLFASVHAYGNGVYPGTGGPRDAADVANVFNVPLRGMVDQTAFRGAVAAAADRVRAFAPDCVIFSAGFDGHRDDLAALGTLDAADYGECTAALLAAADGAPCVSVLEGGYGSWCEPKKKAKPPPRAGGLSASIDDARLASFDASLAAHLAAIADFHGGARL